MAGLHAPVRGHRKTVWVKTEAIRKGVQSRESGIMVEIGKHNCICRRALNNAQTGQNMRIVTFFDISQQKSGTITGQFRVLHRNS